MASTIASFANFLKQSRTHAIDNREVLIAGVLYKKPERNSLLWKKRYCVIYANELQIVYFLSLEDFERRTIRGKIPFSSVHAWDGKPNGFQFYTPADHCFRVYTETAADQLKWLEVMQKCIDNAPDRKDGARVEYVRPVASSPAASPKGASFRAKRSDSWREEDPDVLSMAVELADLRSEVTTLKAELASYEQAEKRYGEDALVTDRTRRGTVLDDGTELNIEPREMERMRAIFNLFDVQSNGFISEDDLLDLHAKLGEPISNEDAREAISYMHSKSTTGEIDFNSFMKWWNDDHAADNQTEAMRRYQAKFKFLKARIANPEVGNIETEAVGAFPSFEFRVNFYHTGINNERQQISPWHDIPLYNPDGTVNFICEIPKWTRKKMEIATGEPFNPIKQDTKNGKLREYGWGEMMFNYGAMPQTWEDPSHVTEGTGCVGDNDPIDVVEIGTKQWRTGSIVQVKILGVLALIDDNETDWKVICINVEDHYAPLINDVADIEAHMPGCITAIHDWLRDYKLPQVNKYGYDDKCMGRDFAEATVAETHEFWKLLIEQRGGQATV
uniref:inorganic diphosphatase n=1 Tax=Hyaloperonospora arabidopsidis (strain Emoy2) TaxID=559515 RepID=M4BYR4_HYAAE